MKMTTLLCSELIMYCEIRFAADDYLTSMSAYMYTYVCVIHCHVSVTGK